MDHSWKRIGLTRFCVLTLLLVHFFLGYSSLRIKSPTIDEYTYIATGYLYVKTGDFRLDRTHPPLIRLLIGLPLQFLSIQEPPLQKEKWDTPESYDLGYILGGEMLLKEGNDVEKILMAARIPILLLSCALAFLLYGWGKELDGPAGGFAVLFLYVFCPNMLAHARLATLDLGTSFFMVLALYALYKALQKNTRTRLLLSGVALGMALAAKVTALLLIPIFGGALAWNLYPKKSSFRAFPWLAYIQQCGRIFLPCLVTLFLVYGFPFKPFYYLDTLNNVVMKSLPSGKGGEDIPGMPHRNYAFYLAGNYSTSGWPYYYLAAVAVKTPLAVFLLLLLYLGMGTNRWRGIVDGMLIGTIVLLHALAACTRVNIGLRHVLPFYPLLYLYLGRAVELSAHRWGRIILAGLAVWYFGACMAIHPDYLAYFNEAAGGPDRGQEWLDDSNLDWGQDLGRLAEVTKQFPGEPLYIGASWIFQPAAFGFLASSLKEEQIADPPRGIVAVSKHWAIRHRFRSRSPYYFNWPEKYTPIETIGHSIWVFRFKE